MTRFLFGSSAGGHVATPVTIANGGTGQTSAQAAMDALAAASGSLVQGDIFIVDSNTNVIRLARGTDNYILKMNGSNPNWEAEAGGSWVGTATSVLAMSKYQINYGDEESSTISSGSVALDGMLFQKVDTEGSASSDDLNTLSSTQANSFLILGAENNGRTIVIKDGGGNMLTAGDFSLDSSHDRILLEANSASTYVEISRSNNLA